MARLRELAYAHVKRQATGGTIMPECDCGIRGGYMCDCPVHGVDAFQERLKRERRESEMAKKKDPKAKAFLKSLEDPDARGYEYDVIHTEIRLAVDNGDDLGSIIDLLGSLRDIADELFAKAEEVEE